MDIAAIVAATPPFFNFFDSNLVGVATLKPFSIQNKALKLQEGLDKT